MKATGIIRRIDDLGRIVIPKEIRANLRIKEGEPMEIFITPEGGVVFQKYDPAVSVKKTLRVLISQIYEEDDLIQKAEILKKVKELEDLLNGGEQ